MPDLSLECQDCGLVVTLPEVIGRPGYVEIKRLDNWTSPPLRCPVCSLKTALIDGTGGAQ